MSMVTVHSYIEDDQNTVVHREHLDGWFLVDGEVLSIEWEDGTREELPVQTHSLSPKEVTEFGGAFHGLLHKERTVATSVMKDGERVFLRFSGADCKRVNSPLGENTNERD